MTPSSPRRLVGCRASAAGSLATAGGGGTGGSTTPPTKVTSPETGVAVEVWGLFPCPAGIAAGSGRRGFGTSSAEGRAGGAFGKTGAVAGGGP